MSGTSREPVIIVWSCADAAAAERLWRGFPGMDSDLANRLCPIALQVELLLNRCEPDVEADRDEASPSSVGVTTSSARAGCEMNGLLGPSIDRT